jgi:hypothetical protein
MGSSGAMARWWQCGLVMVARFDIYPHGEGSYGFDFLVAEVDSDKNLAPTDSNPWRLKIRLKGDKNSLGFEKRLG